MIATRLSVLAPDAAGSEFEPAGWEFCDAADAGWLAAAPLAAGSLTPSAVARAPTAAAVAFARPVPPPPIRICPSVRYAAALECPGPLNPKPPGITTSSRPG